MTQEDGTNVMQMQNHLTNKNFVIKTYFLLIFENVILLPYTYKRDADAEPGNKINQNFVIKAYFF